jgi:hypothetical protein
MFVMHNRRIRDELISQLKAGRTAYVETEELIRLMKRSIERELIHVHLDLTSKGCWFIPLSADENA